MLADDRVIYWLSGCRQASVDSWLVTRYDVTRDALETVMVETAARMKAMRERRRARGLRELRLIVPDARLKAVRRRVAKQVAGLDQSRESEAIRWMESVSEFDAR
jgi:hypothetical protein